jgi:hypothetical protein
MKLEYSFTNFTINIERQGSRMLTVVGVNGQYQYQITDDATGSLITSKLYKRAADAQRQGRKALNAARPAGPKGG